MYSVSEVIYQITFQRIQKATLISKGTERSKMVWSLKRPG